MDATPDIAASLAEAARSMEAASSLEDALTAIVHAARVSLPSFEHVGISTIDRRGASRPRRRPTRW